MVFSILGDYKTCIITRKGKIKISLDDGGVRILSEVRYVLELRKNLISMGTLQENGYSLWSNGDRDIMRVRKGAMIVIMTRRNAGNVYKLLRGTIMGDITSVEINNDATKLWHMCLDPLSECGMIELYKRNLLKGVRSCTIGLCKYCVLGKQCRVRFKTRKQKTNGVLDYVHYDVWGATKDPFVGGSKYFVTFTDVWGATKDPFVGGSKCFMMFGGLQKIPS